MSLAKQMVEVVHAWTLMMKVQVRVRPSLSKPSYAFRVCQWFNKPNLNHMLTIVTFTNENFARVVLMNRMTNFHFFQWFKSHFMYNIYGFLLSFSSCANLGSTCRLIQAKLRLGMKFLDRLMLGFMSTSQIYIHHYYEYW